MNDSHELTAAQLYRACDPASLPFDTTAELEDLQETLGQGRALGALQFGIGIRHEGYNLYVMGSPGLGKRHTLHRILEARSAGEPLPPDWCYVNNFKAPHRPRVLRLAAGIGTQLRTDMHNLVRDLLIVLPAAFDTDEYRARVQELGDEFKAQEEDIFGRVAQEAGDKKILLMRTPVGYTIAPVKDGGGEVMEPADFDRLPEERKEQIKKASEEVRQNLRQAMQQAAGLQREHARRMEKLNEDVARHQVDLHFSELESRYAALPAVTAFLAEARQDILEHVDDFRKFAAENKLPADAHTITPFNRYYVNVLVDNGGRKGAPVVYEDNPTYQNLVGRIEHMAQFGTLLTDFTLIKGGALHRANGGSLVLDARKLLTNPFAWDALKRALRAREMRMESLEQMLSLASTISLEPEPIALDVKVVLIGERLLYYLLSQYDPEFPALFKVEADFSEDTARTPESSLLYARLLATLQRREQLLPLDRAAVARLIEQAARRVDDSEKLSLDVGGMLDLMREADHWARAAGSGVVGAAHVEQAVAAGIHRGDQLQERMQEMILRGVRLIDTAGTALGQVNGLAVIALGKHAFGHPSRITATARLGEGDVVDIEREVKLGQPIHSKGVLILSSFVANRFGQNQPLSLSASLVFEQSYGMIDGDSASAAESCALLSCLSGCPLRQDLAITGSINQHGAIQAIGGVNEKIEGFFDICRARGLSGTQGVIIPASNVMHLMLRRDVLEAVREGRFHVYAVSQIDEALQILSGVPAGAADGQGGYPQGSVNARVLERLAHWAKLRRHLGRRGATDKDREAGD
ncbi:MAG: AAA family ATPase [Nevskia sp.]|nr:AAA family ATPase [Nevskia sp.]